MFVPMLVAVFDSVCVLVLDLRYCSFFYFCCSCSFPVAKGSRLPRKLDKLRARVGGRRMAGGRQNLRGAVAGRGAANKQGAVGIAGGGYREPGLQVGSGFCKGPGA